MENSLFIREITLSKKFCDVDRTVYPYCLHVVNYLDKISLTDRVTFFVGENGSGKSTLLEAIAINFGFNPEGGSRNYNFSTTDTHSDLYKYLTLVKGTSRPKDGYFLRAESFYNVATETDSLGLSYGNKSFHEMSHGESFLSLIANRFWGNGLYILDEPEAALSPQKQLELLIWIKKLKEKNSQFIIATHSPILLAFPEAKIFVLSEKGLELTPYKETENYMLTKQFLDNPDKMLKYLFE
ncbi:MAG TPA: AAA family ATPase [Ruminiclostridium sp.]|nr:AAA family ATPase [Ruminiclostridium sp.]